MARLSSPLVTVSRESCPDDVLVVQTDNRDLILWDVTRAKRKWPTLQEGPNIWLTFVAWAAARRTGSIPPDLRYEDWEADVINVSAEVEDMEDVDPTRLVPGPG